MRLANATSNLAEFDGLFNGDGISVDFMNFAETEYNQEIDQDSF